MFMKDITSKLYPNLSLLSHSITNIFWFMNLIVKMTELLTLTCKQNSVKLIENTTWKWLKTFRFCTFYQFVILTPSKAKSIVWKLPDHLWNSNYCKWIRSSRLSYELMRTEMNDFVFCLNEELEVFSQSFLFYQYHLN